MPFYTKTYTYKDISSTQTTTQVSNVSYSNVVDPISFGYTYDAVGNVLTHSQTGKNTITYTYDNQGQLLKAAGGTTYTYTYDNVGNILTASNGSTTHNYTYGNSDWKDLLTKFDGVTITYDNSGNPLSYYNGTSWNFTWTSGRQLASAAGGGNTAYYYYNQTGSRNCKTVNGVTHHYTWLDNTLIRELYDSTILDFSYDANGQPYAMYYNSTPYFYILNLQGDVIRMVDGVGNIVANYEYDPYGKVISATGWLAEVNPLRYRGYYYDTETQLYHLWSRYYDPQTCRFINADSVIAGNCENIFGCNMFAYCFNNPVNMSDYAGNWPSWSTVLKATAIAVTAVAVVAAVAVTVATFGATSIAATIVVSSAITIAAKATEVAVLQGKKSASEGKDTGQVTTDIIESVFHNGVGTVAKTAVTKTAGYATGFYSQSSSFQDVMELQKMDGYNLKTLAGTATHEIANRFTNLKDCVSTKASTGSMLISYGFAGLNVVNTVISIFADDPVQRATSRGYTLK